MIADGDLAALVASALAEPVGISVRVTNGEAFKRRWYAYTRKEQEETGVRPELILRSTSDPFLFLIIRAELSRAA